MNKKNLKNVQWIRHDAVFMSVVSPKYVKAVAIA